MTTLDWNPSLRKLRQFAAVACVVLIVMAILAHRRGGGAVAQGLPLAVGLGVAALGLIRPATLRVGYVLVSLVTLPIGFVVSHIVLVAVFFGVVTPLAFLGRVVRSDPLSMRLERGRTSYWWVRQRPHDKASYLHQA